MVDVVDTFARLHQGGRIAINYDGIRPLVNEQGEAYSAEGEPYVDAVQGHLEGEPPIGVYPLFRKDYQRTAEWYVNWLSTPATCNGCWNDSASRVGSSGPGRRASMCGCTCGSR